MKVLKANWLNMSKLDIYLRKHAKSEGFLNKKPLETLLSFKAILRPFRRITIDIESPEMNGVKQAQTLIDEDLAIYVDNQDHRMLLWRPRYASIEPVELDAIKDMTVLNGSDTKLQQVVDDMLDIRWACQNLDEEYQPRLKRLQADPLSALSMFIPRRSSSLKREQILIDERKEPHAYILASSLITNSSPRDIIMSSSLRERVFVETIVVYYNTAEEHQRLLILETPNAESIGDAIKSGKALTRLCELYADCRESVGGALNSQP